MTSAVDGGEWKCQDNVLIWITNRLFWHILVILSFLIRRYITCAIYITNSMEQSPSSELNTYSGSEEIARLLWNPNVHYHVHNSLSLFPILRHMTPVHTFPPCLRNIHSNIIISSTFKSPEWSFPFKFSDQKFVCISHLSHGCYMHHLSHYPWFDHPNNIWWSVQVMKQFEWCCWINQETSNL